MLPLFCTLALCPVTQARLRLHAPFSGHNARLEGVRRVDGRLVALWSIVPYYGTNPGVYCIEKRANVYASGVVENKVRGVDWGWWKTGDTPALENLNERDQAAWLTKWKEGRPVLTGLAQ